MAKKKEFRLFIREVMDGRTNRWLAKKTLIHEADISRILSGRMNPTDDQIARINEALGVTQ